MLNGWEYTASRPWNPYLCQSQQNERIWTEIGLLLGTVSVSSVHRMALTTLHGRRQQKNWSLAQESGLMKCLRGVVGSIGGGSPLLNWMPLDWLQGGSVHASYNWVAGGVEYEVWGTYFQITGFGSARVGRSGRQSVTRSRIKQSV